MKIHRLVLPLTFFSVCSFVLCGAACKNDSVSTDCSQEEIIRTGKKYYDPLIAALEKYKADNGSYPRKLSQMTPKYLAPQTVTNDETYNSGDLPAEIGTRFESLQPDIDSYTIKFDFRSKADCYVSRGGECRYYGDAKKWNCD